MGRRKKKQKKQGKQRVQNQKDTGAPEWVGGRLAFPFYITEGEPYRPDMILWLELPEELVVAHTLIDPKGPPVFFGDTLLQAMASPMVGPPRRPARVRVADAHLAAEVREAVPGINVAVAPTPELDRVLRHMLESLPSDGEEEEPSYFEGGRVTLEAIESFFQAAQHLYRLEPWKVADDGQVLRLDIPQLGVEGACVSIIGALGESLGLIIFPSLMAFERFLEATNMPDNSEEPMDLGTAFLSLNYERGADLPASMRKEVAAQAWPVSSPAAYPWIQHRDRDGALRPLSEHDVRVITACATSLAAFFVKHRDLFEHESVKEPVCESFFDEDDLEVRFTVPYEAGHLFTENEPQPKEARPARQPMRRKKDTAGGGKVGRNKPCPCGSGKKYKKCCLAEDRAATISDRAPSTLHELDQRLVEQMMRHAQRRFGDQWLAKAAKDFDDPELAVQLLGPWAVYNFLVDGKPIVDWYIEDRGRYLSGTELGWLSAQQASWLSIWEVLAVTPGHSITLRDLLTSEERTVQEVSGSKGVVSRDAILGRVVDHEGISVLGGIHPRPLPPVEAAEAVRRVRGRLRRKRAIPVDRLQDEKVGRYMIARWEDAVEDLDHRRSVPPRLQNTDGDDMLFTVDHLEFDPHVQKEVKKQLAALEGVEPPETDDPDQVYVFTRPGNPMHRGWENTLIGRATITDGKLRLETNSIKRADALRERIEGQCGELLHHRARDHSDPLAQMDNPDRQRDLDSESDKLPPEEASRLILEMKKRHYAEWTDQPLPALGHKTPQEAVRTKAGREQVDLLLKDIENHEARLPAGQRFDFSGLRGDLGLKG